MSDLGIHIEAVATALFGKPTERRKNELRYGSRGSLKVNLEIGGFHDFETDEKGGVLALIKRTRGLDGAEAIDWMRSIGCDIEDDRPTRNERREPPPPSEDDYGASQVKSKIVKTYDYRDEDGVLLFQVCRCEPKTFRQRKPDGEGWSWSIKDVRQVPYRLGEMTEAIADERIVFIVEGEKDVDNLVELGVPATTNAGGASKWPDDLTPHFRGADVVILPDNDAPGRAHAGNIAAKLHGVAKRVRVLELPELPAKGDVSDWLKAGGTSQALFQLVATHAKTFAPPPFASKFGAVVWGEPHVARVRYDYVIKGLIPRGESVLIYGASQSGKSFLTQDLGMAVARGVDYCGRRVRQGLVVYCAAEAGVGFADKRIPAYRIAHDMATDEVLPFVCLTKKFDLFGDDKQVTELIAEIRHFKDRFAADGIELVAVVIDTLNKVTPAMDEIHGKDVGIVMNRLDRIRAELDTGLWLVHHKNAANTGPRGHTSLYAGFETAIEVIRTDQKTYVKEGEEEREREERLMVIQKQREGEDGGRFKFCLRAVPIGADVDGDQRYSCAVQWIDDNHLTKREVKEREQIERMSEQRRALYLALKKAIEEHGVPPPAELGLPKSVDRVVDVKHWRQMWLKQSDDMPETARKAVTRVNEWLLNTGYIGRSNPWVWLTDKGRKKKRTSAPQVSPETEAAPLGPDYETMDQMAEALQ